MEEIPLAAGGAVAAAIVGKVFVEKISEGVGGIFRPRQTIRMAEAEAVAALIKAHNTVQITDLQKRAAIRQLEEATLHQAHIEEIVKRAEGYLTPASKPEGMEKDWIINFFDKARLVGDSDFQDIWAKILAGEANSPGSFSKRTLSILADMGKSDAEIFLKICRYRLTVSNDTGILLPSFPEIVTSKELDHMDALGLVSGPAIYSSVNNWLEAPCFIEYFDRFMIMDRDMYPGTSGRNPEFEKLEAGRTNLTMFGSELEKICQAKPIDGYFDKILERWKFGGVREISKRDADNMFKC